MVFANYDPLSIIDTIAEAVKTNTAARDRAEVAALCGA